MKRLYIALAITVAIITHVQLFAQCTGGCPSGAITSLPTGTATLAAGTTYCLSTTANLSSNTYTISGTLIIQAGTTTLQNATLNKTGVIVVKNGARLVITGTLTGETTAPSSTIDNITVCNGGYLDITGSFSQGRTNLNVTDFGIMKVTGAFTASYTDTYVKIGNGSLIELCSSFNINKSGFFTETSTGVSYLVVHGSMIQSSVNGWLSNLGSASKIKFTSDASTAFLSHPAAYTCNACGNYNLAPTGTSNTCGSAANSLLTLLPINISSFYSKITGEQLQIMGVVDNSTLQADVLLERSNDGNQFTVAYVQPTVTQLNNKLTYQFTLTTYEANKFYRLRVLNGQTVLYSTVLFPRQYITDNKPYLFPNPAHDRLNIQIPEGAAYTDINILNQAGQLIQHQTTGAVSGLLQYNLPNNMAPGTYFIQLIGNQSSVVLRWVKN